VEVAVNGIGERAGNSALEEIVMALRTRRDYYNVQTGINTQEIIRTSRLVSRLTGYPVQPNKAIVGKNAFEHEAGIHQDGVLKNRQTYEIMDRRDVGLDGIGIVLGKHSGRHAVRKALEELGVDNNPALLNQVFVRFKEVADSIGRVSEQALEAVVEDAERRAACPYTLNFYDVGSSSDNKQAIVKVILPNGHESEAVADSAVDDGRRLNGPLSALFSAIETATDSHYLLQDYMFAALEEGRDALGIANVVLEVNGRMITGRGLSADEHEAAAWAYLDAVGKADHFAEENR
jgi:2-isopropylmalate synthase